MVPALALGQTFVQENGNTVAINAATVSVTYAAPETAGNLNVVVVGWTDRSSSVISVGDDNNNTYTLAGTSAGHGLTQAIYYARNIALPNNTTPTVTVTFNQNAGFPDVRILEYSGLSTTAPLDNWTGSSGNSVSADSEATTTSTSDLILGAGTTGNGFTGAGTGFTVRVITSPFGDIVEDMNGAQPAGTYNATAPLTIGTWVMQVVGFSTTGVNFTDPPTISPTTPITPVSGGDSGGTPVTINGTNFQPGAVVLFGAAPGGISGINCTESGGTTITCLTPASVDSTADVTVINVDGQVSSAPAAFTFQNITPTIGTVTPATSTTNGGAAFTVTGTNFQAGAQVLVGGLPAGDIVVQDNATITGNSPGLPVGTFDVIVKNPDGGTVTKTGAFTYTLGTGPINYIQRGDAATSNPATTFPASFANPQQAGNLNVVIIGWADTLATVSSVTDTEGNTYVAALPLVTFAGLSQIIYYAKNIVGDSGPTPNQVTVTFNQAALAPDLRILEYSGLDPSSPIDSAAGNSGTGILADTGACTTTAGPDLIVAGANVQLAVSGPGADFNLLDINGNGNSAQHQIVSVAGSCEATAAVISGNWVIQSVAFKTPPAPVPDFSVSVLPVSQTVVAGSAASYTVSVGALNGFNSPVILTCSAGLPTGASCTFIPSSVTPGASAATSALTITTAAVTPAGTDQVTVTGTSGSVTHDVPAVGLTVNAAPDYTIAASAFSPASVAAGGSAASTITITALNGFAGPVNLSCSSITPVVTSPPTCAFVPPSIPSGSGTSTLTVSTLAASQVGAYTITVAGAGSVNHNTAANLTVTAAPVPDFTIASTTLTPASVTAGSTATSTITVAPTNGFNSAVNLTCSVTPVATRPVTCSLNPTSVASGSGTSTLTVATTAATTASVAPRSQGIFFAMLFPIGLALLGTGMTSHRKRLWGFLFGCLLFSGLMVMPACGGARRLVVEEPAILVQLLEPTPLRSRERRPLDRRRTRQRRRSQFSKCCRTIVRRGW